MSGINCGTYPVPTTENAIITIGEQSAETATLTDTYNDLELVYQGADATYQNTLTDTDGYVATNEDLMSVKAVSLGYYNTGTVEVNISPTEAVVFNNPFSGLTDTSSFYQNSKIKWTTNESTTISGVVWRTYANGLLVSLTVQDMGNRVIGNADLDDYFNLQSLYSKTGGTTTNSVAISAQTLSSSGIITRIGYKTRFSNLSPYTP